SAAATSAGRASSKIARTAAPCTSSRFRASLTPYSGFKLRKRDREDEMPVSWAKCLGALALAAAAVTTTAAVAADPPKEMKLYVFSSGALNLDKSIIQNGSSGKVQIPVGFYLIRHPKGDVLFDCGNNDKIITDPDYWGPFVKALDPGRSPDIAIDAQLAKINV